MNKLRVLDLFSGIGAYSLGLERTGGFRTVAFCEIEDYPRKILKQHWPDVPIYDDVRTLDAATLRRDGIAVDVIVGGWPCQDISLAGTGAGLDGERSGLWSEIARLAGELRPQLLILENSSALLGINGGADFGRVLGDLAALGYDAEWHCLSAAGFDAPHIRDRLWIAANASGDGCDAWRAGDAAQGQERRQSHRSCVDDVVPDANGAGLEIRQDGAGDHGSSLQPEERTPAQRSGAAPHPHGFPSFGAAIARRERHTWEPESGLVRVASGTSNRVERIKAIGNCNPPIIPETIGRAILEAMEEAV